MNQDNEKTKLEKKLAGRIGDNAAAEQIISLERLTKDQLDEQLLDLSKTHQGIINTRNADNELAQTKAKATELGRPYREQISANKELQRLVSLIISDKFGDELMDIKVTS